MLAYRLSRRRGTSRGGEQQGTLIRMATSSASLRAAASFIGCEDELSAAKPTSIECSCARSSHRTRASTQVLRRKPRARAQDVFRKLDAHRHSVLRDRVPMRVVGLALHCPRRADSAKLAHECRSGSSDGHHPSQDDRPTSYSTRRPISLGGLRCGRQFHCRPSLRRPGLSVPRVTRTLGTKCLPATSYLAQGCPTRSERSGRAEFTASSSCCRWLFQGAR